MTTTMTVMTMLSWWWYFHLELEIHAFQGGRRLDTPYVSSWCDLHYLVMMMILIHVIIIVKIVITIFIIGHCHHHHRWNSLNNQSPVLTLSQPFSGSCLHSAPVFILLCIFCGCVFDIERSLWHRKMSLTQKYVFHTERGLWDRKRSLTQKYVFDTKWYLWHRGMLMKSSLTFKNSSKFSADVLVNFPLKASMSGCGLFQVWQSYLTILELRSTLV